MPRVSVSLLAASAATLLATSSLRAQSSSGPDVIVGDLYDLYHASPTGSPSDPVHAYGIGTIACNIGDQVVRWVADTSAHPVIAGNIYRLSTISMGSGSVTRLEQLGQSWLKHGFTALTGNVCNTCDGNGGGVLGVGCSDPYAAALNASQFSLGPRSNVNPATGVFPFPRDFSLFAGGAEPSWSGPLARRVQVQAADLTTPGSLYFIEGQYVAHDDAMAGNQNNNASYRRVTVVPASLSLALADTTQRTRPAIMAWRDHGLGANLRDNNITLQPVDVPGDGRFWIGSRVTQIGPSLWHYEYAVQNLNSDRAGASLLVSVSPGTQLANVFFRDVNAHSGEIWDSTDWSVPASGTVAGSAVQFTCLQTWVQNPEANALRWGTLYNFAFDANTAPADGAGTLGLFKPAAGGGPASVTFAVKTPGGGTAGGPPVNDSCSAALSIGPGVTGGSTLNATSAGPSECVSAGSGAINNDVWYRYVHNPASPCAGNIQFSLCSSSFDTRLAVYASAECPTSGGTASACNDDSSICGSILQSEVSLTANPGQTYLIRIGGLAARGNFLLTITPPTCPSPTGACCSPGGLCQTTIEGSCLSPKQFQGGGSVCEPNPCPQPPRPPNDLCGNAQWIADGAPITSNNYNALTDRAADCTHSSADVWYVYRPIMTSTVVMTTDNMHPPVGGATSIDTSISVYDACDGAELACDDDSGNSPDLSSLLSVELAAGSTYFVRVAGFGIEEQTQGLFTLKVIGGGGTLPTNTGACCQGTLCTSTLQSACTGAFQGAGTACGPDGNPTTCCPANFNQSAGVSVQDIFDFLGAYFLGLPGADFNGSAGVTVQDLFDFLGAYFVGCQG